MQVGTPEMTPVACYLDIEGIIALAKAQNVDAIHPGYGVCARAVEAHLEAYSRTHPPGLLFAEGWLLQCRFPVRERPLCEAL